MGDFENETSPKGAVNKNLKILLVDDNPENRFIVKRFFRVTLRLSFGLKFACALHSDIHQIAFQASANVYVQFQRLIFHLDKGQ